MSVERGVRRGVLGWGGRWVSLAVALAAGGVAPLAVAAESSPRPRLVHLDGRPVVLDAPLGLRVGQPLYVLDPASAASVADRLPVAVVTAAALDGPRRWTVVPLCVADGRAQTRARKSETLERRAASRGAMGRAAGVDASGVEPPPAGSARSSARPRATGLPMTAPVAVVPAAGAPRLGRCSARARGMPADDWRPHRSRATVTLDVGAADHARPGDAYALFGTALADHRTGRVAGFALRAVCRVVAVAHLSAECAVDRSAWPDYDLSDWQQGGAAYPVDAPAVGDLARLRGRW